MNNDKAQLIVALDVDTLTDGQVTLRNRDSMTQERMPIEKVQDVIQAALKAAETV